MGRIEDLGLVADKGLEWKQRAVDAEAERDQLRAEVERLRGESEVWRDGLKLSGEIFDRVTAERDAATTRATTAEAQLAHRKKQHDIELLTADGLADTAAGLRRALEDELSWSRANGPCQDGLVKRCMCPHCITERSKAAIAATSAEHERKLKAEGAAEKLNEMADGGLNWDAVTLRREAESVLLESTNGR